MSNKGSDNDGCLVIALVFIFLFALITGKANRAEVKRLEERVAALEAEKVAVTPQAEP